MYTGYVSRPWQTLRSQYEAHECLVTASIGSVSIGHPAMPSFSDQAVLFTSLGKSCPKITRQSWKSGDVTKSLGRGGAWYVRFGVAVWSVLCVGPDAEGRDGVVVESSV